MSRDVSKPHRTVCTGITKVCPRCSRIGSVRLDADTRSTYTIVWSENSKWVDVTYLVTLSELLSPEFGSCGHGGEALAAMWSKHLSVPCTCCVP